MNKQNTMKIQTCVLRVNVHCDGCSNKIRKKLRKTEGVHEVRIDVEQGKVTVSGNVDPATLIKKLNEAGKHAELWGPQKGPTPTMNGQFKNTHIGKDLPNPNGGFHARIAGKEQKSVKWRLPEEEEEDDDSYEDDDEFDDEFDEGFTAHHKPPTKAHDSLTSNGHPQGKTNKKSKKKGGGMNMFFKGILGKTGDKKGTTDPGKTHNKAANQNGGGKTSYKSGAMNGKAAAAAAHKNSNDSWSEKMGENFEMNTKHGGGGGGGKPNPTGQMGNFRGGMGGQMGNFAGGNAGPMGNFRGWNGGPMGGQIGNFEAVRGLQPGTAMNMGNFQGHPYNQQQMAHMMLMNQQRENSYMRPHPAMSYGPPQPLMTDQYTHIFSDESTSSCSIM